MSMLHTIIENQGKQAAIAAIGDRCAVEAAASYMGDADTGVGFLYSGLCQAALPHRALTDNARHWEIKSDYVSLLVEPGLLSRDIGPAVPVGVPYGSRARLILLYLQSEAIRTKTREVALGRSMRDWLSKMNVPIGGKTVKAVRDQVQRITLCRISFQIRSNSNGMRELGIKNQSIVESAFLLDYGDSDQGCLFVETAKLSQSFFDELQNHAVPLDEAAIRAINNNSIALDIYAWLAFRLHALKAPTPVSWTALKTQFGSSFGAINHFKTEFCKNLSLSMAVYPHAKVEVTQRGLTLMPSHPPVRPVQIAMR